MSKNEYPQESMKPVKELGFLLSGLIIGAFLGCFFCGLSKKAEVEILYISESEMLNLEKERIKNFPLSEKNLFFGKPAEAINLLEGISKEYEKENTRLLFADESVVGKGVKSISKSVHQKIINKLKSQK